MASRERAGILTHRYKNLLLLPLQSTVCTHILVLRLVRTEPGALLECDGAVARKEHEHKCIELRGTRGVRHIPHCWHPIVDRGEEVVCGEVPWELRMVVDILRLYKILRSFAVNRRVVGTYLNENLLCPFAVRASVCNIVRKLAEHVKWLGLGGGGGPQRPCVTNQKR